MSVGRMETVNIWSRLRSGGGESDGLEIPTIATSVETGFGRVRQALGPNNEPRLLLPLGEREHSPEIADTAALSVRNATYLLGRRALRFIDHTCSDSRLEGIFAEVTDEILKRICGGDHSGQACSSTIDDYRSLLTSLPERRIPAETVAGLMGELIFLERLLAASPRAWVAWRGPLKDRHDFRAAALAVEVKTSQRRSAKNVRISSVEQLLPPEGGELHLFHCQLEQAAVGELTIEDLAARSIRKASSPKRVRELLALLGCVDPASPEWNEIRFNLESTQTYAVVEGFPSITPRSFRNGNVPVGISSIDYSIDLDQAERFHLSTNAEQALIGRMVDCL